MCVLHSSAAPARCAALTRHPWCLALAHTCVLLQRRSSLWQAANQHAPPLTLNYSGCDHRPHTRAHTHTRTNAQGTRSLLDAAQFSVMGCVRVDCKEVKQPKGDAHPQTRTHTRTAALEHHPTQVNCKVAAYEFVGFASDLHKPKWRPAQFSLGP